MPAIVSTLKRLVRRPPSASTLDDAVAEVESYLIDALGRQADEMARELAEPHGAAEIERRYRQLVVWVRLLHDARWLFRGMGLRERRRMRRHLRRRSDLLADFHAERLLPVVTTDLEPLVVETVADDLVHLLACTRAVLLNVVGRVEAPYAEAIRDVPPLDCPYPPADEPEGPRIELRGVVSRSAPLPPPTEPALRVPRWVPTQRVAGDARRVLTLCLETLALPGTAEADAPPPEPARPWS